MGLILSLGFLLLVSLVISAALTALERLSRGETLISTVLTWINFIFAFALVAALFATIYKVLPSVKIAWRGCHYRVARDRASIHAGEACHRRVYRQQRGRFNLWGGWFRGAHFDLGVLLGQILLYGAEFTHAFAYRTGRMRRGRSGPRRDCRPGLTAARRASGQSQFNVAAQR